MQVTRCVVVISLTNGIKEDLLEQRIASEKGSGPPQIIIRNVPITIILFKILT